MEEDEEDVEYSSECQTGHPGGNRCSDLCSGGQGHEEVLVDIQHPDPGRRPSLRLGIESSSSSSLLMTSHSDCLMKTEPLLLPITPTPADSRTGALQTGNGEKYIYHFVHIYVQKCTYICTFQFSLFEGILWGYNYIEHT